MNVRATLTQLRDIYRLVDELPIDAGDRSVLRALLSKEIARCERRLARMLAKLAYVDEGGEATRPIIDADDVVVDDNSEAGRGETGEAEGTGCGSSNPSPTSRSADSSSSAEREPKGKGHGRNGAGAFVNAK